MSLAVITPAFNAAATIDEMLASIEGQTLLPDEVIVADDGSTDDTASVARGWASRLPVRVVATGANLGPSGARACAIAASASTLLATVDADDVLMPDHFEALLAAYASTDDGLASADVLRWIPGVTTSDVPLSRSAPLPARADQLAWLLRANHLSIASVFSRARYEAVGGFRPEFRGTEDWDLWVRLVRSGAEIRRPDHPTMLYRLSSGNVSGEDRLIVAKLQVLEAAAREGGPNEQRAIRTGRRHLQAAAKLNEAYALASDGRAVVARVAGLRAIAGIAPVAKRGVAMALAPRYFARRRAAVRYDPAVWLKRYGG